MVADPLVARVFLASVAILTAGAVTVGVTRESGSLPIADIVRWVAILALLSIAALLLFSVQRGFALYEWVIYSLWSVSGAVAVTWSG